MYAVRVYTPWKKQIELNMSVCLNSMYIECPAGPPHFVHKGAIRWCCLLCGTLCPGLEEKNTVNQARGGDI